MSKYAIIQLAGKQFKVAEGDTLTVDRLDQEVGGTFSVSDVLLTVDGSTISVGTPLVAKATVQLKVVENNKGDKLRVATYKAKSRYRKVRGHRQSLTQLEVVKIA